MDRRAFLMTTAAAGAGAMLGVGWGRTERAMGEVMTVNGPISPSQMGFTLTHEHVLVDFIGAEQASPDRYDRDEAFGKILPHLQHVKELGCVTFVECTPSYIGRDVRLLERLSAASGLQILTNVGYYGAADDKFVPAHAYDESAEQLAQRWTREWELGIDGTDVRPGFIKIGVDPTSLSEIDRKLVVAAAKTHRRTGLLILSHTAYATPAMEQLEILEREGIHPSAWVWTHAQNENDNAAHEKAARQGAWIAFDGLNRSELDRYLKHLAEMKARDCLDNVLLSHDAGWYRAGEPDGGSYRPHDDMFTTVLPTLKESGFTDAEIHTLTVANPRRAFAIGVREA
jgi:phosphotriesterase-related protein